VQLEGAKTPWVVAPLFRPHSAPAFPEASRMFVVKFVARVAVPALAAAVVASPISRPLR